MDGSAVSPETIEAVAEAPPKTKTVGDKAKKFFQPWKWEVGPKTEKPLKWWALWRWKFWNKPPIDVKRSPIPGLGNLIKVDRGSLDLMVRWAGRLATLAVIANLVICAMYAFIVATQSELPLTRGWDLKIPMGTKDGMTTYFLLGAICRWMVVGTLAVMALLSAVVMQLGSDFVIPFAAGLAGDKHRVIPTVGLAAFVICITLTASIKIDVFTGWGRERIAQQAERLTISEADQRILDRYPVPPPELAESDAKIKAANDEIGRLTTARAEQAAMRDKEESGTGSTTGAGRGPKWQQHSDAVTKADADIGTQSALRTAAMAARADRLAYDGATKRQNETVRTVTEHDRSLVYDSAFIVWIRSLGMSGISPFLVLTFFALRGARAEAIKQDEINRKRGRTRQQNANTFETEWSEEAPVNAPKVEHDPNATDGAVNKADTGVRSPAPGPQHPDKAGDGYGALNNGHGEDNGTDVSGKPADQ